MFYCLMSFVSVLRTWQVCINHIGAPDLEIFNNFEERKDFLFQMYDANFMVADLYETLALVFFGKVITSYLNAEFAIKEGKKLEGIAKYLQQATKELTISGVKLFQYSCGAQAAYTIFI